jgi:hypothetical protein
VPVLVESEILRAVIMLIREGRFFVCSRLDP